MPLFVLVPGHCFLAYVYKNDATGKPDFAFLETTMLGYTQARYTDPKTKKEYILSLSSAKNQEDRNIVFGQIFQNAMQEGEVTFNETSEEKRSIIKIDREKVQPIPVYE